MEAGRQEELIARLTAADATYPAEAYRFVLTSVTRIAEQISRNRRGPRARRHITGQELALGMRDILLETYGCMAADVLAKWNVSRTDDFGQLVYRLIEVKLLSASKEDRIEDFAGVFDFHEAFTVPFQPRRISLPPLPVLPLP